MNEKLSRIASTRWGKVALAGVSLGLGALSMKAGMEAYNLLNTQAALQEMGHDPEQFVRNCLDDIYPDTACSVEGSSINFFQRISSQIGLVNEDPHISPRSKQYLNTLVNRLAGLINEGRIDIRYARIPGTVAGETRFIYDFFLPGVVSLGERPLIKLSMIDPTLNNASDWGVGVHEMVHVTESKGNYFFSNRTHTDSEERKAEFYGELTEAVLRRNGYSFDQQEAIHAFGVDLPEVIYYLDSQGIGPESNIFHFFSTLRFRYLDLQNMDGLQQGIDDMSQGIVDFADNPERVKELMERRDDYERQLVKDQEEKEKIDQELQEVNMSLTTSEKNIIATIRNKGLTAPDYFSTFVLPAQKINQARLNNRFNQPPLVFDRRAPRPTIGIH